MKNQLGLRIRLSLSLNYYSNATKLQMRLHFIVNMFMDHTFMNG